MKLSAAVMTIFSADLSDTVNAIKKIQSVQAD
jgi:hypothetical protein